MLLALKRLITVSAGLWLLCWSAFAFWSYYDESIQKQKKAFDPDKFLTETESARKYGDLGFVPDTEPSPQDKLNKAPAAKAKPAFDPSQPFERVEDAKPFNPEEYLRKYEKPERLKKPEKRSFEWGKDSIPEKSGLKPPAQSGLRKLSDDEVKTLGLNEESSEPSKNPLEKLMTGWRVCLLIALAGPITAVLLHYILAPLRRVTTRS